jgi:hypothetical protein
METIRHMICAPKGLEPLFANWNVIRVIIRDKAILAIALFICLTHMPNNSKLNEIAPTVTGATSCNSLHR